MEIVHRPGKEHLTADALSRLPAGPRPMEDQSTSHQDPCSRLSTSSYTQVCYTAAFPVVTRTVCRCIQVSTEHEPVTDIQDVQDVQQEVQSVPDRISETVGADRIESDESITYQQQVEDQSESQQPAAITVDILHLYRDFRDLVIRHLPTDRYFSKLYRKLKQLEKDTAGNASGPTATFEQFRLDRKAKLLYLWDPALNRDRLCIPFRGRRKLFQIAHNQRIHQGIH